MAHYDFDYSIIDIISALGLTVRKYNNSVMYVDCPWCEVNPTNGHDGTGKLEIVIAKNFCHCCRFDNGCVMLTLFSKVTGCTEKEAHKKMLEYVGKAENKRKVEYNRKRIQEALEVSESTSCKAPDEVLDRTYRAFLGELKLKKKHYYELISPKRGLTLKTVNGFGFKSIPLDKRNRRKVIENLLRKGCQLEGVPGFFVSKKGHWEFNAFSSGFFIPIINVRKQVIGMQFKPDNPKDEKNKYICFSSPNKNHGASSGSPVHLTTTNLKSSIYLTEGALKADIAYVYSGKVFASVQGVNSQKCLEPFFEEVKERGIKNIIDCFDNDFEYNKNVEKARNRLKALVEACGLNYLRLSWDSQYKGIDDYLINVPKDKRRFKLIH